MKKAAIFDLDGTLLHSLPDIAAACNAALKERGFSTHTEEQYLAFIGNGVYNLVERMLPKDKRTPEIKAEVKADFDRYYRDGCMEKTRPFDGIEPMLERLIENDVKLAVLSNKGDTFVHNIIAEYFPATFDVVMGQRDGFPIKPDPTAVNEILRELEVSPEEAIYVGDSDVDILTGKNAGMDTIGCMWGYRSEQELRDAGATYVVKSPKKAGDAILRK